eukprot:scaffold393637_cov34-Prasinocladus_malaysianus.AAC.1
MRRIGFWQTQPINALSSERKATTQTKGTYHLPADAREVLHELPYPCRDEARIVGIHIPKNARHKTVELLLPQVEVFVLEPDLRPDVVCERVVYV